METDHSTASEWRRITLGICGIPGTVYWCWPTGTRRRDVHVDLLVLEGGGA